MLNNSRFYIVISALLISLALFSWLRLTIASDQLLIIRTEQCYGFIAVGYLYLTLIISPIRTVAGEQRLKRLLYARRGFGLSTWYFALLHAGIALWGQLDGFAGLHLLPSVFQYSLLGGATALGILTLMALTPSDQLIPHIPYRWWKRLHRIVYVAGILIIVHVWTIGTHLTVRPVELISYSALMVLFGLESYRCTDALSRKYSLMGRSEVIISSLILWVIIGVFLLLLPVFVANYHGHMEGM